MRQIPAHSRSARMHQDRPVTAEVAGSSPVAPALNTPLYGDYDSLTQGGAVPLFTSAMQGFTVGLAPLYRDRQSSMAVDERSWHGAEKSSRARDQRPGFSRLAPTSPRRLGCLALCPRGSYRRRSDSRPGGSG